MGGFYFNLFQNVMANVQTLLENADSAEILIAVVDVIQQLSTVYPLVFNSQFRVSCCFNLFIYFI